MERPEAVQLASTEERCWALDQGSVRLSLAHIVWSPHIDHSLWHLSDHNSTSDPKHDEMSRATGMQKGSLGIPRLVSPGSVSRTVSWRAQEGLLLSTGWQQTFFFLLYVFIVYIMMLLSEGTETFMNFRYDLHNIFCRALAFYKHYFPRVAITLVYNQHAYSLFWQPTTKTCWPEY